jgi:hypothetical protein
MAGRSFQRLQPTWTIEGIDQCGVGHELTVGRDVRSDHGDTQGRGLYRRQVVTFNTRWSHESSSISQKGRQS